MCWSFFLSKRTEWTGNFTKSVGIHNNSVQSDLSMNEVCVSMFPCISALEESKNFVVDSDWLSLCDREINERGLLAFLS